MNELKLNETGLLYGKLVKCVEHNPDKNGCEDCAFITLSDECNETICSRLNHDSGEDVIYIPVEK